MAFQKGNAGKPKGAVAKLTRTFKDLVTNAIEALQEDPKANIIAWAKENPTDFYKIASRLIPSEVNATIDQKELRDWEVEPVKTIDTSMPIIYVDPINTDEGQ